MSMYIGEALAGEGNEIAHIDLLIGSKDGPVGVAFANALARQSAGHNNLLAVITPNLICKPATVLITKVTIKGATQAVQMFGPAQAAVARAVADSVASGVIPARDADNLVIVCGVFIHWEAKDDTKIYQYNYEATKMSIARAMKGEPKIEEIIARKDKEKHPFSPKQTMDKRTILVQLDSDPQPSVFDRVVAVDAGADEVFSYGGVTSEQVQGLVHGCIFTRGAKDLKRTALFIGGSDVAAGERLLQEALKAMIPAFGLRVSVLLDANGANTTAAAAVRAASLHLSFKDLPALVLGGTGPVGQRIARLLAREGAEVRVGSRQQSRAAAVCTEIAAKVLGARLTPVASGSAKELGAALEGRVLVVAAGAAGAILLPKAARLSTKTIKVAIDLNAVPPLGIEGVDATDKAKERDGVIAYGAIGVGDTKMKVHKAAIALLFASNDQILDAEEVYQIAAMLP